MSGKFSDRNAARVTPFPGRSSQGGAARLPSVRAAPSWCLSPHLQYVYRQCPRSVSCPRHAASKCASAAIGSSVAAASSKQYNLEPAKLDVNAKLHEWGCRDPCPASPDPSGSSSGQAQVQWGQAQVQWGLAQAKWESSKMCRCLSTLVKLWLLLHKPHDGVQSGSAICTEE